MIWFSMNKHFSFKLFHPPFVALPRIALLRCYCFDNNAAQLLLISFFYPSSTYLVFLAPSPYPTHFPPALDKIDLHHLYLQLRRNNNLLRILHHRLICARLQLQYNSMILHHPQSLQRHIFPLPLLIQLPNLL